MRLSATHALALRRLAIGTGALAASATAHRCAVGDLDATAATPVVWAGLLAMLTLLGGRFHWRPRGFARTLAVMAGAQGAVHVAMSATPWAFGLTPHHAPAVGVGTSALAAHAAAAVALALLVVRLEALLDRAVRAVRAVRRWLRPRLRAARSGGRVVVARICAPRRPRRVTACRGPPAASPA